MNCIKCGRQTHVIDSRPMLKGRTLRRRRECLVCGHRFTTMEVVVP